jgi:hypothetical protein
MKNANEIYQIEEKLTTKSSLVLFPDDLESFRNYAKKKGTKQAGLFHTIWTQFLEKDRKRKKRIMNFLKKGDL